MSRPVRIQLSRAKGFRLQAASLALNGLPAVKVDRSTRWGNPFDLRSADHCWTAIAAGCRADRAGRQQASVMLFRAWLRDGKAAGVQCGLYLSTPGEEPITAAESPRIKAGAPPTPAEIRAALAGQNIACWCKPGDPCHADVWLEIANADTTPTHRISAAEAR